MRKAEAASAAGVLGLNRLGPLDNRLDLLKPQVF